MTNLLTIPNLVALAGVLVAILVAKWAYTRKGTI